MATIPATLQLRRGIRDLAPGLRRVGAAPTGHHHTGRAPTGTIPMTFQLRFREIFDAHRSGLQRFLVRLSGDPDLAADLTQETFVRLLRRGSLPDSPNAWLFSVALNLFRNSRATGARRRFLLSRARSRFALSDTTPSPAEAAEAGNTRRTVRAALNQLSERDRNLLLLRAEGLSYRELAQTLGLNESSIGTLLARAKRSFQAAYREGAHAPR